MGAGKVERMVLLTPSAQNLRVVALQATPTLYGYDPPKHNRGAYERPRQQEGQFMLSDENRVRFWAAIVSLMAAIVTLLGALLHFGK